MSAADRQIERAPPAGARGSSQSEVDTKMSNERKRSRRTVLRALGATVALPWLEAAGLLADEPAPSTNAAGTPPKRFAFLFFGDGIHPPEWWAKGHGESLELGPAFASLAPVKGKINVIDGLRHPSDVVGGHARGAAGILTGVAPRGGREIRAETSLDQLLARKLGQETALSSLVLSCERPVSGFHESGYSMLYSSHVSWNSPVAPVPPELYPSLAFDSLFGSQGGRGQKSVLDHVLEQLGDVSRRVSRSDRDRIDAYATSIREVETRLERLARHENGDGNTTTKPDAGRPPQALPATVDEHSRLMCDMIALAFQTDRTRVATLLLTNNLSGQVYPFLGLRDDHHSFSHGWQGKEYAAISRFWVEQYAYLLRKLDSISEGDGTVLDHSCVVLANEQWTAHNAPKVPLILGGSLGGKLATGRALEFESSRDRKLSGLYLALLDHMGLDWPRFGDATEPISSI